MRYALTHRTAYRYTQPVSVCHNLFRLQPRVCPNQHCASTSLSVDPEPAVRREQRDFFGNPMTFAIVQQLHRAFTVEAVSDVELRATAAPLLAGTSSWESVRDGLRLGRDVEALERYYLSFDSPMIHVSDALRDYAAPSFPDDRPVLEAALELSSRIHRDLVYEPGATTVATTPEEALTLGRGVCQDFAHLAIGCVRALGLAARYVSGYLVTDRSLTAKSPALVGAEVSHAWFSVWTSELGWVDLDPTNDLVPTDRHITLAWGRDYGDVSPVKGVVLGGGDHTMEVAVEVVPSPA